MKQALLAAAIGFVLALIFPPPAFPHDPHHRADLNEWAAGLKNQNGTPCCNGDDWEQAEVQWESENGKFKVYLKDPAFPDATGDWYDVPESAIIKSPNRAGIALLWVYWSRSYTGGVGVGVGHPHIRCFVPGPLT